MDNPARVRVAVLAVSGGSCAGKPTWETATSLLRNRFQRRFGDSVSVEYIELFSSRSLDLPELVEAIGAERLRLPVALVNDQVVSDGAKLNEGLVARRVAEILHVSSPGRGTYKNDV